MVHGFGIYDGEPGKARENVFYGYWSRMIERCYSQRSLQRHPTYVGTIVCEEWKYFSNFQEWAIKQWHDGFVLDKDLIDGSAMIYSPETCAFIPQELNKSILDRISDTPYPLGVWYKQKSKGMTNERAKPFTAEIVKYGKGNKLGNFSTPEEAHKEWQLAKIKYFEELIEKYQSIVVSSVIDGLLRRITILQSDYDNNIITKTINKV